MKGQFIKFRFFVSVMTVFAIFAAVIFVFSPVQEAQGPPVEVRKATYQKFASHDAVTSDIRRKDVELVRVEIRNPADHKLAAKYGRIVNDYGSFVVIAKKRGANLSRSGLESQPIERTVNLPGAKFDPISKPPTGTLRSGTTDAAPAKGYYVVQFGGIVNDEWLDSLRDVGVEILQYVPHNAFFVYGDSDAIANSAAHARVRWVGRYLPEQKLSPELRSFVAGVKAETATFDVAVFARANFDEVQSRFANSIQGRVLSVSRLANNFFNIIRIEVPLEEIDEIARIDDVVRIDPYVKPQREDERAAQIVAGNFTSSTVLSPPGYDPLTQFGVDGTNVTVAVSDDGISIPGNGGFYITSANTVDGPLRGATAGASGGHGHINASIIAGNTPFGPLDPTGYNYGVGVAPKSHIINIPFLKAGNTTTDQQSVDDTISTLGPNGVRGSITNNSWGAGTNGNVYDSLAATYDGFVQDASIAASIDPISVVFSAGNSGPGALTLTRPKASKNTIVVANSENIRTELGTTSADNMDDLRSSSSRGPTSDGRIKPDITAPGSYVAGSRAGDCSSVSSCFDANHAFSIGTSHAAPQIAGVAALFTQFWKNNSAGVNPSPALIKASIINTGQEMNGLTTNAATIPNGNEGWGRVHLKNMFDTTVPIKRVNQTVEFSNPGDGIIYSGTVANATKPFRVSLVWTDPPAAGSPALINNLDLTVTIGANTYRGNVFSGGNSTTGGANSTIDNVENVFLPAGIAAGTPVTITINAAALNGNGILGNADATDQHFALVAYNFTEQTGGAAPFDFDGDGKTDVGIFRPGAPNGAEWWYQRSSNAQVAAVQFGTSTDKIVPGDFTGDGKADIAFFRPSEGFWFVLRSEDSSFFAFPWGSSGDIPAPADYDGDGRTDPAVFRPSSTTWFISNSGGGTSFVNFGISTDKPVMADYDGDAKADIAIWRAGPGEWWVRRSTNGSIFAVQFGVTSDRPVQGDFTGDGKADIAFWRPADGNWFVLRSEDFSFFAFPFGSNGDVPVPGDY
ncbi:MAG: S8 family serine peptidase, partial [Pyrinomonadaceae bacterium]